MLPFYCLLTLYASQDFVSKISVFQLHRVLLVKVAFLQEQYSPEVEGSLLGCLKSTALFVHRFGLNKLNNQILTKDTTYVEKPFPHPRI